jgi:hypothetical protein
LFISNTFQTFKEDQLQLLKITLGLPLAIVFTYTVRQMFPVKPDQVIYNDKDMDNMIKGTWKPKGKKESALKHGEPFKQVSLTIRIHMGIY